MSPNTSPVDSPPTDPIIRLDGVGKRFETPAGTVVALEQVDLAIMPGQLVVVLGPSGCGKTTLLNVIGALDRPTEGTVDVGGRRVSEMRRSDLFEYRRQTVAFVFQAFNLFPELTALENVRFGAERGDRKDALAVATQVLLDVGLGDRLHHFPHQLSGGEQQRVAIARSLATGNPILLADEPTGELDFATGIQILQLLRDRADAGQTVLLVTHNREIARIADLVVELRSGHVVSTEPPADGPVDVAGLRW